MNTDDSASLIYALLCIMLMIGSIGARRLPLGQVAKMILAWIAIFAAFFVVFSFRPELSMIWNRITGELTGEPRQTMAGKAIRLVRQDDGHFWITAELNGQPARMMIDSGATITAINSKTARDAGVVLNSENRSVELNTANGVITARTAKVKAVKVGDVSVDDHYVVVSNGFGDTNVAGMNFLDTFESWTVSGDVMLLTP
jgi:aspartyl protease family protein